MHTVIKKIRLVYLPFLVIAIGFIVIYSFLNWLVIIKSNLFAVKQGVINFWLPFILSFIIVFVWLRPRIRLLKLTGGNGNLPFLYQLIGAIAIAVPTIIAQIYLETATGKLTNLESINQIDKQENTKYYTLKKFFIDKSNIGVHSSFDVSGKYNDNFNMHLYVVLPILRNEADTNNSRCPGWLGIEYSKKISNKLNEKEKERQYQDFAESSQKDFDNKDVNQFIYLDRVGNTEAGDGFKEAVKKNPKYTSDKAGVFLGVNEPFENRNGSKFAWIFGSFGIAGGIWLIMLLIPKFNENELTLFKNGRPAKENEAKEFLDFLKPKPGFFITPIIIYLNVLVFILMFLSGLGFSSFKGEDLLNWGANYGPATTGGDWWRLITNTFLHGGIMHLLANMYGLLFVGIFLEPLLGVKKFLAIYLTTGILASCASLWWHDATVSVGASGAIFGLYGAFVFLVLTRIYPAEFGKAFLASTLVFIGFNLLMGLQGGIDNAAHIGGLLSGIIIGLILYPSLKKQVAMQSQTPG